MKNLLILTSSFPFSKGDYHGNFVYYHALGEARLGYEVHVLCPHIPGTPFEETMDGVRVHRFPYFYPYHLQKVASDTGMYSGVTNSKLALFQLPFFMLAELVFAHKLIRRYHIDIIHSHWIIPQGFTGTICKKIWHIPLIVSSHGPDVQLFEKWKELKPLLCWSASRADILTANSSFTKNALENLVTLNNPCIVIPMGVQPVPLTNTERKTDSPQILFVGRLIEWKGTDTLIRAMVHVIKKRPESILNIVGEGPEHGTLVHLSRELDITQHIRFLGPLKNEALEKMFAHASVLVLPSRPFCGIVMEGLGVVVLEAMSHGVPVIGSNGGGITDIIEDGYNGFLVPYDDDAILAEKILTITGDDELRETFRRHGFETVKEKFSWDAISRQFSEVYDQLPDRPSRENAP